MAGVVISIEMPFIPVHGGERDGKPVTHFVISSSLLLEPTVHIRHLRALLTVTRGRGVCKTVPGKPWRVTCRQQSANSYF